MSIAVEGNELHHLILQVQGGLCVPPNDPLGLASALRYAAANPEEMARLGANGRRYLEEHFSRQKCITQIEAILQKAAER